MCFGEFYRKTNPVVDSSAKFVFVLLKVILRQSHVARAASASWSPFSAYSISVIAIKGDVPLWLKDHHRTPLAFYPPYPLCKESMRVIPIDILIIRTNLDDQKAKTAYTPLSSPTSELYTAYSIIKNLTSASLRSFLQNAHKSPKLWFPRWINNNVTMKKNNQRFVQCHWH